MNYTEVYNSIYNAIKTDLIPHEVAHGASLRISDAINGIYMFLLQNYPESINSLGDIINNFWTSQKFGGYDLDDKGQPIGFGINATGLNNKFQ